VFLRPGTGKITVNGKPVDDHFNTYTSKSIVRQALLATETADKFDVMITPMAAGSLVRRALPVGHFARLIEFNAELRGKLKASAI